MDLPIIKDNFFNNPLEIRQVALNTCPYDCILNDHRRNSPGVRWMMPNYVGDEIKKYIEESSGAKIETFFGCFHLTSGIHQVGLIHEDGAQKFAGVVYLTENPPPESGTIMCKIIGKEPDNYDNFYAASLTHDVELIEKFVEFKNQYNKDNFEIEYEIENKFNRLTIYDGTHFHAPYHYFGNNLFNSRLVVVFWFSLV